MKIKAMILFAGLATALTGCGPAANVGNTANGNSASNTNANARHTADAITVVERPQKIKDLMAARGDQDNATPKLQIVTPVDGSTVKSSTVKVTLKLSGDLKGYKPGMDEATHTGNHIHVILDNQPYEAYYNLEGGPFELRNVTDGEHTLRVFPSRPWHESYKDEGAFQMVKFTVKNGGADATKPTTANGNTMANANTNAAASPTPEGKDMKESTAGAVDGKKPLLTYSRPKGEYKGADTEAVMLDFWLANAKLAGDGGEYKVRYTVDEDKPGTIDKWAPIWLAGLSAGTHKIKLELIDKDGNVVDNGGYNSTVREVTITK